MSDVRDYDHTSVGMGASTGLYANARAASAASCGRWPMLVVIVSLLVTGLGVPSTVEASSWASAVRSAITARTAATPGTQALAFGRRAYGKPHDVIIHRARHPQAAAHIEHAQKRGQPSILHIGRQGADQRRAAAIGNINSQRKPGRRFDRDEYPPAFTREGAGNASVRWIHQSDNRGAGASMAAQTRHLPDGSKIRVLVR